MIGIAGTTVLNVGVGTVNVSSSGTAIGATPHANTLPGQLVVMVGYVNGATCEGVSDAGDGWVVLDCGYDGANVFGIFMAACIARRGGGTGYVGMTLPGAAAFVAQTCTLQLQTADRAMMRFDISNAIGSRNYNGFFSATASDTALNAPAIAISNQQYMLLVGRGYDGTNTAVANIGSHTEAFETHGGTPAYEVALNFLNTTLVGGGVQASVTSALTGARVNRAGVRCAVPVVAAMMPGSQRYLRNQTIRS